MEDDSMNSMIAGMMIGNLISQNNEEEYRQELNIEEERRYFLSFCPEKGTLDARISEFILLKDMDGAQEFLKRTLVRELVFRARNQRPYPLSLDQKIERVLQKYQTYYDIIRKEMPENLRHLTAEELCKVTGMEEVQAISEEEYERLCSEQEKEERGTSPLKLFLIFLGVIVGCFLIVWLLVEFA